MQTGYKSSMFQDEKILYAEPFALFAAALTDPVPESAFTSKEMVDYFFHFFSQCPLFRWKDANNDCEDRANAICILLEKWKLIPLKVWVFAGTYLKKDNGSLTNFWNYHVAATLAVKEDGKTVFYVIDPATLKGAETVENWASQITATPHSYYLVKDAAYYIFDPAAIEKNGWHKRNRQNYRWTIQGLAGINGVSKTGKAQLVFQKAKILQTDKAFRRLLNGDPQMNSLAKG